MTVQTANKFQRGRDDVNAKNYDGSHALLKAAFDGYGDIVKLLIDNGATDATNDSGRTALYWARRRGHENVAKISKLILYFFVQISIIP